MTKVVANLVAARALIADPKNWCKGEHALNEDLEAIDPWWYGATQWSADGAVFKVTETQTCATREYRILETVLPLINTNPRFRYLTTMNDHADTNHSDVMLLFDTAIQLCNKVLAEQK